jgi:hypothetical protein
MDIYAHFVTSIVPAGAPKMLNSGFYDFLGYDFGVIPYTDAGSTGPHPVIVKYFAGGSDFVNDNSGLVDDAPSAYKICPDDWLPNDQKTWWWGYNEKYDIGKTLIFGQTQPPQCGTTCEMDNPACHGYNYDYTLQRIIYTINQVKNLYNKSPNTNPMTTLMPAGFRLSDVLLVEVEE